MKLVNTFLFEKYKINTVRLILKKKKTDCKKLKGVNGLKTKIYLYLNFSLFFQ